VAEKFSTAAEDPVYLKIAEYRLSRKLPDAVSELDLMRMFSASRFVIQKAFSRIQQEGWAERRAYRGWTFLPMIDSPEAYDECISFRQSFEPAAILSPSFRPDLPVLEDCRKQQTFISQGGYEFMTQIEFFEASARFHETLVLCSGNRFALQAVQRLNQLRRLVEYRHAKRQPLARQLHAQDHLAIIDDILKGDRFSAAARLHKHLERTRIEKATSKLFGSDSPKSDCP
jgi:DNA-binding GntR family transcriptional regulator